MEIFFTGCAEDPGCSGAYPDLEEDFFRLVDQLNAEPVMINVNNLITGASHDVLFDGVGLLGLLFQSLYNPELTSLFPILIHNIFEEDYTLLSGYLANSLAKLEFVSTAMQFSVQCHEEAVFANPDDFVESIKAYPELEEVFANSISIGALGLSVCNDWGAGKAAPVENEAVSSDIPTLIITGEHDPVTPPAWGEQVAQGLSNSYFFEFPGAGHGASFSHDCPRSIALAFLDDPSQEPPSDCIYEMSMSFVMPFDVEDIAFEPIKTSNLSFTAAIPAGWIDVDGEYFVAPDRSVELVIKEIQDRSVEEVLASLRVNEVTNELSIKSFNWSVAEINLAANGSAGYVATTPSDEGFYMLLVVTTPEQAHAVYEPLFIHILESFSLYDT
jgi:hypothetical protein